MKLFFRRFYPYIREYKLFFFIALLATMLTGACTAWGTYLVKPVLDDIFMKKDMHMLYVVPALVILSFLGKGVGVLVQTYFISHIGLDIVRRLRDQMLKKILSMDMAFFNQMRNGELIARSTYDIGLIRASVSNYLAQSAQEIFTVIGLVCVVIYQSPKLAIVGLIIMPLAIYPLSLIVKSIKKVVRKNQEKNSDITAKLTEIFSNVEIIKASNGEEIEIDEFSKQNYQFFKLGLKNAFLGQINSPVMEFLGAIAIGLVIFMGGREVISGDLSAGAFFSFMTALFMLYTPIKRLVGMVSSFQEAMVASDRIFEILDKEPLILDGDKKLEEKIETLSIRKVELSYGDIMALKGVDIDLKRNDIAAFVGKSGSGKSSLVNLILRLYDPDNGEICINDQDIRHFTQYSIREKIAIVTQKIFIFNDSVIANVAYGNKVDQDRVLWALKQADALDFVSTLKDGIHTILDEFGSNLSGGQRQRIAIARAIYRDPEILILDEATSALDMHTEEAIKNTIAKLSKDRIVILIAHRPSTIALANKIYRFHKGEVDLEQVSRT